MEQGNAADAVSAGIDMRPAAAEQGQAKGRFEVECYDAEGNLKWKDHIDNLIVNTGKNLMLDNALNVAATASTAIFMGLVNGATTPTYAAGDTMASHAGWTELTTSTANRGTPTFGAAANGAKATSSNVAFAITAGGTVAGVFIVLGAGAVNTNGSTAGVLFSAGNFSGGNRGVSASDTLNVSYSASI